MPRGVPNNQTDSDPVAESVALILKPLSNKRDELKEQLHELKGERREALKEFDKQERDLARHIERMDGILALSDAKPRATKKRPQKALLTPPGDVLVEVFEKIESYPEGTTHSVLRPQLTMSTDRLRLSISWLREHDFIRLAKHEGNSKIYRALEGVTKDDILTAVG